MIKKILLNKNRDEEKDVLREFLSTSKKSFIFVGLFSLFINILMLLPAVYMLAVYDIVVPSRSESTLVLITALVIVLFSIMTFLQIVRGKILIRVNNKIDKILGNKIINSMLNYTLKHPAKASIQPFNDFQQIKQFLTGQTVFAFFDIPWIPIYLGVLYVFHPYYGIMATAVIIIVIGITLINEVVSKKYFNKANETLIKSSKFLTNTLTNAEVIEAMGMRNRIYSRWLKIHQAYMFNSQVANDQTTTWSNIVKSTRLLSQSLILGLGGYLAINLEVSTGMIVAGSIVLGRALAPVDLLVNTWRNFSSARISYKRLNSLLNEYLEEKEVMKLPEPRGEITLSDVVVIPPDSEIPSIKGISLHINPGEIIAIIGPSGAGKSSLARTILGVWKPASGKVEIDGADINQWDHEYLGQYIGYLPQDIELFEGTIAENIARFEKVIPEKVLEAAQLSGAHDVIIKFPDGYNTYIGPGGITLSGGQRQRIALARALYNNPKIVILDEPNSNLDDAGEKALLQAIIELKRRKTTVVIISHKISILEIVDKIAFIQDGILKLFGDPKSVLQTLAKTPRG